MGCSISWVATQSLPKDELLARLGLADTGRPGNPAIDRDGVCVSDNGDWRIVACADTDWGTGTALPKIAPTGPALVGGYTDRTDMFADLHATEGGEIVWSVGYHAANNDELSFEGRVPRTVREIVGAALNASPDDEDLSQARDEGWARCEAVLKAWRALIGYEPVEETNLVWTSTEVLRSSRRLWSRLFGG